MEIWLEQKTRPRLNYEWIGKNIYWEKHPIHKIEK